MLPTQIANFFLAMQAGKAGAEALAAHFAEDAVYEEPFTGETRRHTGRDAVMQAMALGWDNPMPDMRINVDRVETNGAVIDLDWTCFSPAIPGGQGRGHNRYVMRDGLIAELVTTLEGPKP
ncbi:nuclear transport factor 2 family protein [Yoonia sp. R2331]|uniref:nuclear transport factor 2 family protein n=1 Tax=Yoonia sp. R2331 TaxID=3237238 RepID=UPI0034E48AE4